MFKGSFVKLLVTTLAVLALLPFTTYADGYSFQVDGDQWNQRFSGTNKVYTDGIYVGEMGAIDAYMDNYGNTYNGTNIIDATAYPGAGQDDNSTYNGTLDVTANDIISSKTTVDDATVNAKTTVTVNEVLSENNLNAGVQFNNSSFNNDVTLSGSGAVNLEGSTVNNLVLGNIPQMQTLLDYTSVLPIIYDNLCNPVFTSSSGTRSFSFGGKSYSYSLSSIVLGSSTYYYNYSGYLKYFFTNLLSHISQIYNSNASGQESVNYIVNNINGIPILLYRFVYRQYSYDADNDVININLTYKFNTYLSALRNLLDITIRSYIEANIAYMADTWYRWYNPNISLANSKFWKAYNTDTGQYDDVNLSTVLAYITWYLGQLYNDSSNVTETMHTMTEDINTAASTFQDMEQKEHAAIEQIQTGFDTFLPDLNQFQSFRALAWCSDFLQQVYLALGTYGTVISVALLFGVCLQFIGYFRYK